MRKFGFCILSLIFSLNAFSADFTYTHLSNGQNGNNRYPGIGANSLGERLVVWRSGNGRGMLYSYFKEGTWSKAVAIPRQKQIQGNYLGSDIVVDSEDRFHVVWELMNDEAWYATFRKGEWTDPVKIPFPARYEGFQISLDIRSNDELVVCACLKPMRMKDIFLGYREKGKSNFSRFMNVTNDKESSSSGAVAVDADDHLWMTYKGEVFGLGHEVLRACLFHLNEEDKVVGWDFVSEEQDYWAFLEWVAANKVTGVVMVTYWLHGDYWSSWYNQGTKKWSPPTKIGVSSMRQGDFSMWTKVVAQGKDFYCLAKNTPHELYIVKFNGETETWENPILVYQKPTVYFDLYPSNGNLLIAFCTRQQPTQVYFTSMVGSEEAPKIRVKSAVNVRVETKSERSFFSEYFLNYVTWQNNPWNVEHEVTIDHFNLYRKLKTEATYGTTPYQSNIPASQLYFEDKQGIEKTPLYDYAVTCVTVVNGESFESEIEY
jgi:hypothetical protein